MLISVFEQRTTHIVLTVFPELFVHPELVRLYTSRLDAQGVGQRADDGRLQRGGIPERLARALLKCTIKIGMPHKLRERLPLCGASALRIGRRSLHQRQ